MPNNRIPSNQVLNNQYHGNQKRDNQCDNNEFNSCQNTQGSEKEGRNKIDVTDCNMVTNLERRNDVKMNMYKETDLIVELSDSCEDFEENFIEKKNEEEENEEK